MRTRAAEEIGKEDYEEYILHLQSNDQENKEYFTMKKVTHNADALLCMMLAVIVVCFTLVACSGKPDKIANADTGEAASDPVITVIPTRDSDAASKQTIEFPAEGKLNDSGIRFRTEPDTRTGRIIDELNKNTVVTVTDKVGAWYAVTYKDKAGYIHSDYVDLSPNK